MTHGRIPRETLGARQRQFFDYFRTRAACIAALQVPETLQGQCDLDSLRVLLICSHLEALAKVRYAEPREAETPTRKSGKRFCALLEEESDCGNVYRLVALPRLKESLVRAGSNARAEAKATTGDAVRDVAAAAQACEKAATIVEQLLTERGYHAGRQDGTVLDGPSVDLPVPAVERIVLQHGLNPVHRTVAQAIRAARYSQVVWEDYRCALVHEARTRSKGFDFIGEDRAPYYFPALDDANAPVSWFTVPAKFMLRTLRQSIERVQAFCAAQRVDPYTRFGIA
jgi:hypothetical protein